MKKYGILFWLIVAFVLCSVPGRIAGQEFMFSSVGECGSGDYRGIAAQGNYVYNACLNPGLIVVDITNPSNPVEVSSTTVPGSAECIAVSGNYAYLGTSRGLHIVNISNPAAPTTAGYHYTSNPLERILVNGQTVYALSAAGFQVVDVSNPSNPVGRGSITFSTAIRGADAKGSILYLSLDRLTTVDASDANNPEIISQSASQISPNDIRIEGDYAYVSDFYGFDVYDISEPEV
ncbi:MAG: hypothetical protein GY765_07015, partial [bacterium]|nr:hypothetical protein [bacterium]